MLQKQETCLSWRSLTWAWGSTRGAEASSLPCTEMERQVLGKSCSSPSWTDPGDGKAQLYMYETLQRSFPHWTTGHEL